MIDFRNLETFLWVANLGSFSAAAAKLATTQPAVSHRIVQLEQGFGVRLLERDHRSATLTEAGRKLYAYAERAVKLRTEVRASMCNPRDISGPLRVGVVDTITQIWLPDFVRQVEAVYPNLNLEIHADITMELRRMLIRQELDLVFAMGPLTEPMIENRFLCDYPVNFIASPKLNVPKPATIEDLARFRLLTFPRRTQPYEILHSVFNAPSMPPVRIHSSNVLSTFIPLAIEALGILVIPPIIVERHIASGHLEIIPTDVLLPDVHFTASWLNAPDALTAKLIAELAIEIVKI